MKKELLKVLAKTDNEALKASIVDKAKKLETNKPVRK